LESFYRKKIIIMKKLFQIKMPCPIRPFLLTGFILLIGNVVMGQQTTTVLPNNSSYSNKTAPQGALRYQRGFYLITPAEMSSTGLTSGMNINAIGFAIGRAMSDTAHGRFKVYLQNTTDVVSRADTGWNTVSASTNAYYATGLFPGDYEWQVRANCSASSPFTSSQYFSNADTSGCNNPYNLNTQSITSSGATFTWESVSTPVFTNYKLEYKAIDVLTWTPVTTTDTFYQATGLSANKSYQWRVRSMCSPDSSAVNSASFTTNSVSNCNTPSGLVAVVTNDSLVKLSWTPPSGAIYFQVQFRRMGTNAWSATSSFTDSANLVLPAGTTYQWRVRTVCGADSTGDYADGSNFTTGGTAVCYEPTNIYTSQITGSSAKLAWTAVAGATSYTVRYRLKNTISWTNAISPMTMTCDSTIIVPDTIGAYDVPFHGGSAFTYNGGGVYVAWEFSRPNGALTSPSLILSTTKGTSIQGVNGQDSVTYLLCMISRADSAMTALPTILGESKERPETRFGSSSLQDSVAVVAVYALGMTAPKFQSPTPISALVANRAATDKNYAVTLTVKEKTTGAIRYTNTQNVTVTATDTILVSFNGWSPSVYETDSIIVSVPAQANENVVNNNSKGYVQQVNASVIAYDDGTAVVSSTGFGTGAGLILAKHALKGCGKVLSAKVYLSESAKNKTLHAVVRNTAGAIVATSPDFTPGEDDVNGYHSFYFTTPPSFTNEDFYIGIAQAASTPGYTPVGTQWEDAEARKNSYYVANADGSNLRDSSIQGRLMIRAEVQASSEEPFISGNLVICTGGTNTLTAGSNSTRFANAVSAFSSQYANVSYSASQALGSPDVYPLHTLSTQAWVSNTPDDQREYIELKFPGATPVNYVDIYETSNPGAIDSVFVKNPGTNNFELVYSATAASAGQVARKNRISFTTTAFNVSEVRIAIASNSVAGYNSIDAVGIGQSTVPGTFASYLWMPGGETTATKAVSIPGIYKLTVTNASGCQLADSVTVTAAVTTPPTITASGPGAICQGDSVTLTSSQASGNSWSTGATTQSITVNTAGSYTVSYNDGSGCGVLTSAPFVVTINPLPTVSISGSTEICLGNQNVLDAGAGFSSYQWSTGETTQTISISTAGPYSVTVTNSNGCRNSASVTATFVTLSAPTITGNLSFCPGSSTTLDAGAGYSSYLWSTGATSQTISVSASGTYSVTVTNDGGCTASASVVASPFTPPAPQISGTPGFCTGGSTVLTADAGYASYAWSTGATTASITVNAAGVYTVTVTDNNGCTGTASVTVAVFATPTPAITGTLSFCAGTSTTLNAGPGYASYLWSTGATTQTITVNTVGTFTVTVTSVNGCTGSASATTTNTGSLPATPGPISGAVLASCSTGGHVYSISPVTNTSHYVWTVPAGATIVGGQGTTSITVSYNASFQGGFIIVAASNACGQSPSITPRKLFVQSLAGVPGAITGQVLGVCGPTTKTYSIAPVSSALSYTWSAPAGASVTSGQGTTSATISFTNTFTSGTVCVTANNACGSSTPSCVMVSGASVMPGAISGPTNVCKNQRNVIYSIPSVQGATSYTWTVPQASQISVGQGGLTIVVNFGPHSGNITVKANGACGSSATQVLPIVITPCFGGDQLYTMPEKRPVPEVLSNYGGSAGAGKINLEWTLGEPRVESETKSGMLYTQGFHQPLVYAIKSPGIQQADGVSVLAYPNPFSTILKLRIESVTPNRPLVIQLTDIFGRVLQTRNIIASRSDVVEMNMTSYIAGSYLVVVKDVNGKIINSIKLVKVDIE
jgi:hypothetical protein